MSYLDDLDAGRIEPPTQKAPITWRSVTVFAVTFSAALYGAVKAPFAVSLVCWFTGICIVLYGLLALADNNRGTRVGR